MGPTTAGGIFRACETCGKPSHIIELARNVMAARPETGICDHCGQIAPCTERRIATAFLALVDAQLLIITAPA